MNVFFRTRPDKGLPRILLGVITSGVSNRTVQKFPPRALYINITEFIVDWLHTMYGSSCRAGSLMAEFTRTPVRSVTPVTSRQKIRLISTSSYNLHLISCSVRRELHFFPLHAGTFFFFFNTAYTEGIYSRRQ